MSTTDKPAKWLTAFASMGDGNRASRANLGAHARCRTLGLLFAGPRRWHPLWRRHARILGIAMMLSRIFTVLAIVLASSALAAVAYAQHRCEPTVLDQVRVAGISSDDVRRISISRQTQDIRGDNNRIVGYNAWVRLESCPGTFVVDMHRDCRVRQVYTRGMCAIPGVKSFLD